MSVYRDSESSEDLDAETPRLDRGVAVLSEHMLSLTTGSTSLLGVCMWVGGLATRVPDALLPEGHMQLHVGALIFAWIGAPLAVFAVSLSASEGEDAWGSQPRVRAVAAACMLAAVGMSAISFAVEVFGA